MNEQEAITRAETWYLQRYDAVAHGHLPVDVVGQEVREDPFLCIDLVPEREAEVVRVLLDLTGEEVALLEEGRRCPRCIANYGAGQQRWLWTWMRWRLYQRGKHCAHNPCRAGADKH